jgi:PAS domain S-box-containing protein
MSRVRAVVYRYGLAAVATALAALVQSLLDPALGDGRPFLTFFAAIALAAWYGGPGPAALAVALSTATGLILFAKPHPALGPWDVNDFVGTVVFAAVGFGIAALVEHARAGQRRAEAATGALAETEERYRRLVEVVPVGVLVNDDGRITFANRAALDLFGVPSPAALLGKTPFDLLHPGDHDLARDRLRQLQQFGKPVPLVEERVVRADGAVRVAEVAAVPVAVGGRVSTLVALQDVTDRNRAEAEVRTLNAELERRVEERTRELREALENVKQLQGLLPICAWCKKVRDDRDYWHEVEHYVSAHTEARFTHGICPSCLARVAGERPS